MKSCSVSGCAGRLKAKGLCAKHYQRLRKVETAEARAATRCDVEGCAKPVLARRMCNVHYARWRERNSRTRCAVDGCSWPVYARRVCRGHYDALREFGRPSAGYPGGLRCAVCHHPDVDLIEQGLRSGAAVQPLAAMWNIHYSAMRNHVAKHLDNPEAALATAMFELTQLRRVQRCLTAQTTLV